MSYMFALLDDTDKSHQDLQAELKKSRTNKISWNSKDFYCLDTFGLCEQNNSRVQKKGIFMNLL